MFDFKFSPTILQRAWIYQQFLQSLLFINLCTVFRILYNTLYYTPS